MKELKFEFVVDSATEIHRTIRSSEMKIQNSMRIEDSSVDSDYEYEAEIEENSRENLNEKSVKVRGEE